MAIVVGGLAAKLLWCLNTTDGELRNYNIWSDVSIPVSRLVLTSHRWKPLHVGIHRCSTVVLVTLLISVGHPSGGLRDFGCVIALLSALRGTFRVAVADCCSDLLYSAYIAPVSPQFTLASNGPRLTTYR